MNEDSLIRRDRMRFEKNSLAANLTILAIVLDVFYFVSIYQSDKGNYYYTYMIGISIVYNLIFMLAAFLSSEGVKNYKKNYSILLLILSVGQIIRIFILPTQAHGATYIPKDSTAAAVVMSDGQYITLVVFLVLSAVCLVASAVVNYMRCTALEKHMKYLEEQAAGEGKVLAQKSL